VCQGFTVVPSNVPCRITGKGHSSTSDGTHAILALLELAHFVGMVGLLSLPVMPNFDYCLIVLLLLVEGK
jgi:hypothetical protein